MPKSEKAAPRVHVVHTEYGDVLLNEATGAYLHLNTTGALIRELLVEDDDVDRAVERIVEQHDVDAATARKDVEAFRQELTKRGLL